ncbi:NUDIX domain-containing protein [Streptoverticillium reticulum]|uniref:NUDIX domain-containing protein n=1 Tax=Streptoverticillium reticulum TaxID=1433415 RepID=UPI0039BF2728
MTQNEHEKRMARPRTASGALFFDEEGHVLLVRPSYKPKWEIPGGYIETGESPLAACRREVSEDELLAAEFHPKEAVDQLLIPRLARRVKHAIAAREQAHPQYLEHGEPAQ